MMRRVVVTGMGIVSPIGRGLEHNWNGLVSGRSMISKITSFDTTDYPAKIAGQIPTDPSVPGYFDKDSVVEPKEQRHMDSFILYGICAAEDAVADADWTPDSQEEKERTGVLMGSGIGGLQTIEATSVLVNEKGPRRVSPFFIPASLINLISGHVSIRHGFMGPNSAVVTACATGTHAIGDAARLIQTDQADVMIAGGAEAPICRLAVAGFSQAKALSTSYNDTPEKASRPWDEGRDGFIMGEGAGAVVLEEYEHAKKRGARIYGEVIGYGMSGDAHHITAPGNNGALRAMKAAIRNGGISPDEVDYINAHGTSTPLGDKVELLAVRDMFGAHAEKLSMSSTKSVVGHLLGAAGAVEAIYTLLAMEKQVAPPTVNLENPLPEAAGMDLVPLQAKEREIRVALSNSFGFGGTNASLLFKKI